MQFVLRVSLFTLVIAVLSNTLLYTSAFAGERVALVIGNSKYSNAPNLRNPKNDAADIARALRQAGFSSVELHMDLDAQSMRDALQKFSRTAEGAEIALLYFAGHGVEIGGQNYLIPTDARLQHVDDVEFEALPLKTISRTLSRADGLKLIVLDACRNNPFVSQMQTKGATRSVGRGLARVSPTGGDSIIAYAAKEGTLALDGEGDNSPYAKALIKHIQTPGLDVRLMFGKVRDDVLESTGLKQEPFIYSSLGGNPIYLSPARSSTVTDSSSTVTASPDRVEQDYKRAETINTDAAWKAFLSAHGAQSGNFYVDLAHAAQQKLALNVVRPLKKRVSVCTERKPMLNYAKYILQNRSKLGRFARNRFGTDALYLSYNYNQLSYKETEIHARKLAEKNKSVARGMYEALVISKLGGVQGLARLNSSLLKAFEKLSSHGVRALILADGGVTYLNMLRQTKAQPIPDANFSVRHSFGLSAPARVIDQSDTFKSKFAALAEQQGELVMAGGLLATLSSLKAYEEFRNKYKLDKELQKLVSPTHLRGYGLFAFHATGENLSLKNFSENRLIVSEGRLKYRRESDAVVNAVFHAGEYDFFLITMNQTGMGAEVAGASAAFLSEILSGEFNPIRSPESSWILSYKALVDFMGRSSTDEILMTFDGFSNRHYRGRVREGLDWAIAGQALKDSSKPEGVIPPQPRLLSKEFDWNTWVSIAGKIRLFAVISDNSLVKDIFKEHPFISAELLFKAGLHNALFKHLTINVDLQTRMKFMKDFMLRLDRRCGAFTSMAGQALSLGGATSYTFASHR